MIAAAIFVAAWLLLGVLFGTVIGLGIREADRREVGPEPTQVPGEWAA
jgi:hypothetical protein